MSFVRRKSEVAISSKVMFDGPGEAENHVLINSPAELFGKGRLYNFIVLQPGCAVGWHIHHGDGELYYILKGRGEYNDNGTLTEVGPGDVAFTNPEEGHSIQCIGDEPLEYMALVLYE